MEELKFPFLGKKVRRKNRSKWEEGIVVLDNLGGCGLEEFIEFSENDLEQLMGLPFQIWDEESRSWKKNT